MNRLQKTSGPLVLASLLGLLGGCTSSGSGGVASDVKEGDPLRISYISYRDAPTLELVNEAHTGRLEQYSEVRANANRKVQTDEVMVALVEALYDYGFGDYEHPGSAPAPGSVDGFAWALQIEGPNGPTHVLAGPGLEAKEKEALLRYAAAFVDTYNATYGLQAVQLQPGATPFDHPAGRGD
jgi:hypothetical protein